MMYAQQQGMYAQQGAGAAGMQQGYPQNQGFGGQPGYGGGATWSGLQG